MKISSAHHRRYQNFDAFCIRNPLYSYAFYQKLTQDEEISYEKLCNFWQDTLIQQAIYLASLELYEQLNHYFSAKLTPKINTALQFSFIKYLIRLSTRCTPFGWFAGCNVGKFSPNTSFSLKDPKHFNAQTRFDTHFLSVLAQHLSQDTHIKKALLYFPNTSLYHVSDQYRYVEYTYIEKKRIYSIEGIHNNAHLELLLHYCKKGKILNELEQLLTEQSFSPHAVKKYIQELIDHQIIVSELEPVITGKDYLQHIIQVLELRIPTTKWLKLLKNWAFELEHLQDESAIGIFQNLIEQIEHLNIPFERKYLFQTDLFTSFSDCELSTTWYPTLKKALTLLNKMTVKRADTPLELFKKAFVKRYEQREVPLSQALDVDMGIGYLQNESKFSDSPILENIFFESSKNTSSTYAISPLERFWLEKLSINHLQNDYILELDEKELANFEEQWNDLPNTISALTELTILDGKEYLYINGVGGSSGANLLGRFSYGNNSLLEHTLQITQIDELFNENALHAEIVHLPQERTGNVLRRPVLRNYEIPYLAQSSVDSSHQIAIDDLYLSVQNDQILLRSAQHHKQVIPHLTNAHNFSQDALPIYQFLCDLQFDNLRESLYFNFGAQAENYIFLPRVVCGNIIFHKARWKFDIKTIDALLKNSKHTENLKTAVAVWQEKYKLPDWIQWVEHDNTLLIYLKNITTVQVLLEAVKHKTTFTVEEFLQPEPKIVQSEVGGYVNQFVFSFKKPS